MLTLERIRKVGELVWLRCSEKPATDLEGINRGEADAEMEAEPDTTDGGGLNDEKEAAWWRDTLPARVLECSWCSAGDDVLPDTVVNDRLRSSGVTGAERPAGGGERTVRATPTVD